MRSWCGQDQGGRLPVISSRILMVPDLNLDLSIILRCVCVCVCVCGLRKVSRFILLTVQFSQDDMLKRLFFSIGYSYLRYQRLLSHMFEGIFIGSLFSSIDVSLHFCARTILS